MTNTLESLERAARRALEEDDTVPATRKDLDPAPYLFLLDQELASDPAVRDAQVRVRLDALRDRVSGPYVVNGRCLRARPMFRSPSERAEVVAPADIVRRTQALLDANRLPDVPGDLAVRIRHLQRECGIGFDQEGYAHEALRVVVGRDAGCDTNRADRFEAVSLSSVRAGDLVRLEEQLVVVYRVETVEGDRLERYRSRGASVKARTHRVFEVDGSFDDGAEGGFRRDTWLYDPNDRSWGSWGASGRFTLDAEGPIGERFTAAYRVRSLDRVHQ